MSKYQNFNTNPPPPPTTINIKIDSRNTMLLFYKINPKFKSYLGIGNVAQFSILIIVENYY